MTLLKSNGSSWADLWYKVMVEFHFEGFFWTGVNLITTESSATAVEWYILSPQQPSRVWQMEMWGKGSWNSLQPHIYTPSHYTHTHFFYSFVSFWTNPPHILQTLLQQFLQIWDFLAVGYNTSGSKQSMYAIVLYMICSIRNKWLKAGQLSTHTLCLLSHSCSTCRNTR